MKKLDRFEEVAIVALGLLSLAGVMSGCGAVEAEMEDTSPVDSGSGGGRVGGRENDTVAPAVGEDVPAAGATRVPVNTKVRLRFSEPMDPESLASAFALRLNLPIDGVVSYDEATHTATFTPATDLRAGKTYTATISTEALDAAGNPLDSARTWSFTTEDFLYRVSVSSDGSEGNDHSYDCWGCNVVSGDGRYVAYASIAFNLVPDDTNEVPDIFRHDWQTGETIRVSLPNAADRGKLGAESHGDARSPALNSNGRYVAFASASTDLVVDDTNREWDIFVHDANAGATTLVSVPNLADRGSLGVVANGESDQPSLSADGRFVVFESSATNLVVGDDNGMRDVFVYDRETRVTELMSVSAEGFAGNGASRSGKISGDGRYVVFVSGASNLDSLSADTNDLSDIYLRDRAMGTTARISMGYDGGEAESQYVVGSYAPFISEDGRHVVFTSLAHNLVTDDTNDTSDVFVYERATGSTKRVSVPSVADQEALGSESNAQSRLAAISRDGRYVTYASYASNLTSNDTNGDYDVFVHDTKEGLTRRVSLASDGTQIEFERFHPDHVTSPPVAMSADGRYVVFSTDFGLVVDGDENAASDVFRVLNAPLPNTPNPRCPDPTVAKLELHGEQSIRVGEDVGRRLELLLENLGERAAEDFTISFYLSEDDEITPDDLWLVTYFPEPLAPGESERVQLRGMTAKPGLPRGSVWIGVIIDGAGNVAECNEENNVASVPVVLGCRDLAPASLELFGDLWARPGDTIGDRLAAAVENLGDLPSGGIGFDVNFYISEDQDISPGDRMLLSARDFIPGSLDAGEQEDIDVDPSAGIPPDWPLGRAYLGVLVDELDAVDECDEGNNTAAITITVAEQATSDLVATDFTLSGRRTVSVGEDIGPRLAASFQNTGAHPTGGFASGVYLSLDEILDGSDAELYRSGYGSFAGGQSRDAYFGAVEIPEVWRSTDANLIFYVDDRWSTVELTRDNNFLVIPVTVK